MLSDEYDSRIWPQIEHYKYKFSQSSLTFLGHHVDGSGVKSSENNFKAIAELEALTDINQSINQTSIAPISPVKPGSVA